MRRMTVVLAIVSAVLIGAAVPSPATPTEDTFERLSLEGAFALPLGDATASAYVQAMRLDDAGTESTIVAATIFVDGETTALECFGITEAGVVTVDEALTSGAYRASVEGLCFDFRSEESIPFQASFDVSGAGSGNVTTRAGSFTEDGKRCVAQIRFRDASAAGGMGFAVPKRGIEAAGTVADDQAELGGYANRCYPNSGDPQGGPH